MKNLQSTYLSQLLLAPTILALCLLFMMIAACDSSTSSQTGTLTGKVILVNDTDDSDLDPVDFSGVTVALYELTELDTAIVRINREYPNIGVQISQETQFDHRHNNPKKKVVTEPNGEFMIVDIDQGKYNVVFSKDGWSYRYFYDVAVNSEKSNSIGINIPMYPATNLENSDTDMQFKEFHDYIITDDYVLFGHTHFEGNSRLFVNPGKRIDIYGLVTFPEDSNSSYIFVSNNYNSDIGNWYEQSYFFEGLNLEGNDSPLEINNIILSGSNNGLRCSVPNSILKNCLFQGGGAGFVMYAEGITVKNSLFNGIFNRPLDTFVNANTSIFTVDKNIFINNSERALNTGGNSFIIRDSYFYKNSTAICFSGENQTCKNNIFWNNEYSIYLSGATGDIIQNIFYDDSLSNIIAVYNGTVNNVSINQNNFYRTDGLVYYLGRQYALNQDQDATYNFWNIANPAQAIVDFNDDSELVYSVIFIPKSMSPIILAGIIDH